MADWKKLLKDVLLADGVIDASETELLKIELLADEVVDEDEIDFLVDLRNSATECSAEFATFFFEALASNILEDGVVDAEESAKLREILYADGIIDADEKAFLNVLKSKAKTLSPEFDALYEDCMK